MRYVSPVIFMRRTLTRDYEMNGHAYREGDKAVLFYWSANRDEAVFADPDRFDITRSPNPHVGFGARRPALLPRRAPGPPGDHRHAARAAAPGARYPRRGAAGPAAVRFINGIKHLPCEFGS